MYTNKYNNKRLLITLTAILTLTGGCGSNNISDPANETAASTDTFLSDVVPDDNISTQGNSADPSAAQGTEGNSSATGDSVLSSDTSEDPSDVQDALNESTDISDTESAPTLLYQGHASIRIVTGNDKVIYIDPYAGEGYDLPADLILITHDHYDHTDQSKIRDRSEDCVVITNKEALAEGRHQSFDLGYVYIESVEAGYNANHDAAKCVGYLLTFQNDVTAYISGDTSTTPQMSELSDRDIDYAFYCCDGIYNMGLEEAAACADLVGALHSIPYHITAADGVNIFDADRADQFKAQNRLILAPGDILELTK